MTSEILTPEKLNLYRFLTVKLADDDLYPHYSYGEPFSLDQIRGFWRRTVRMILKRQAPQKLGLYIHLPFCHQKCMFCFCDSYIPASYAEVETYLSLVKKEMEAFREIFKPAAFTSIYFGGGSPSYLKAEDAEGLFRHIYKNFNIAAENQTIFEGTSRDLNDDILAVLARNKVDRLTIGVQSLDPRVIKLMGRPQTREGFVRVFKSARAHGIPFINIDLVAGLEGQSVGSFISDLKLIMELGADMVHVTGFTPLGHTRYCRAGKKLTPQQKKDRDIMIAESKKLLDGHFKGLQAENSGSCEDAANIQETDLRKQNSSLLGIGYSAQSHAFAQAWYQHPHTVALRKKPDYTRIPVFRGVRSSLDEEMRKFMFSNIQSGFSRKLFRSFFKKDVLAVFGPEILALAQLGRLRLEDDRVVSCLRSNKEFKVLSKLFYSREKIRTIFQRHSREFRAGRDYRAELDYLYANYINVE